MNIEVPIIQTLSSDSKLLFEILRRACNKGRVASTPTGSFGNLKY